jgi:hypothetical protein
MGSIYRNNITAKEINKLSKMIPGRKINNEFDYENKMTNDLKFADLFRLFSIRGDKEKAQQYFEKIEDNILKYLLKN